MRRVSWYLLRNGGDEAPPFNSITRKLVAAQAWVDLERPGVDAAGDVGDSGEAAAAKELSDSHAAAAVVALDEQVFVGREIAKVLGDLTHGNVLRTGDAADFDFVGFAHVDEQDAVGIGFEEAFGFFDGDFERVGFVAHG